MKNEGEVILWLTLTAICLNILILELTASPLLSLIVCGALGWFCPDIFGEKINEEKRDKKSD